MAASVAYSQAIARSGNNPGVIVVIITWVGAAAGGAFPTATIPNSILSLIKGMFCIGAITNPGTPAPDAYDLTVLDENGLDVFGANLDGRHASNTELAVPTKAYPIFGAWTVTEANQDTNDAQAVLKLFFSPHPFIMA